MTKSRAKLASDLYCRLETRPQTQKDKHLVAIIDENDHDVAIISDCCLSLCFCKCLSDGPQNTESRLPPTCSLYALDPKKTVVAPISSTESSLDLLLVVENAVGSFDLESSSQNDDWVGGVAWRGVVAKTLQWFCTCITDLMSS